MGPRSQLTDEWTMKSDTYTQCNFLQPQEKKWNHDSCIKLEVTGNNSVSLSNSREFQGPAWSSVQGKCLPLSGSPGTRCGFSTAPCPAPTQAWHTLPALKETFVKPMNKPLHSTAFHIATWLFSRVHKCFLKILSSYLHILRVFLLTVWVCAEGLRAAEGADSSASLFEGTL